MTNTTEPIIAVDLETTGFIDGNVYPDIICIGVYNNEKKDLVSKTDLEALLVTHIPIFHNASFDVEVLRAHNIMVPRYHDTRLLSYVDDPTKVSHSLANCAKEIGMEKLDFDEAMDGDDDALRTYCLRDCEITFNLYHYYKDKLEEQEWQMYVNIELPYSYLIMEMERTGLYFDKFAMKQLNAELQSKMVDVGHDILDIVPQVPYTKEYKREHPEIGEYIEFDNERNVFSYQLWKEYNPSSNDHLAWALKELYNFESPEKTKSGKAKLDRSVLEEINFPLADKTIEYRNLRKISSTYLEAFLEQACGNYVYGHFNQTVTITGRLSSSSPNLQNIPRHGELGKMLRSFVCAPPGYKLVNGDLSNIEARVLAYYLHLYMDDDTMMRAFIDGLDLHQHNADRWTVTRDEAKKALYTIMYGGSAHRLSVALRCSKVEAQGVIDAINKSMPALYDLQSLIRKEAKENEGTVHSLFGRAFRYAEINSSKASERARAERQVFNATIQGTSADILKLLSIELAPIAWLYDSCTAAAVHDELLFYSPSEVAHELAKLLSLSVSTSTLIHPVPIEAEFVAVNNWSESH